MKAYGLQHKLFYNFTDSCPKNREGYVNWWEVEMGGVKSKKHARQEAKKEISK